MPNFKKPRGGFAKKFLKKSPMKAADMELAKLVGGAQTKGEHMGQLIKAKGKSERSSQLIQNVKGLAALAAGVPPGALPESGGMTDMISGFMNKK
jgi:hypothetical protein